MVCMSEEGSYLRINLNELLGLKLSDDVLSYARKDDEHLYLHADAIGDIQTALNKAGKSFNPTTLVCDDLSFLDGTVPYHSSTKPKM